VSHHILRLAYCQSEDQRKWFLTYECALFKYRAERETPERILAFMKRHELNFLEATDEEKVHYRVQLRQAWEANPLPLAAGEEGGAAAAEPAAFSDREEFYKVPFLQAADLVRNRTVFLAGGYAFVPRARMVSALVARFRAYLSFSLVAANKFLPAVLRDERLRPMLENMSRTYVGPEFGAGRKSAEHVSAADVEELAASAFPLCMQNMHAGLREKHRLKHTGRLQYGLFLKGVGLPLEEALVFWQREFTKGMSPEDFVKKYAYNIRYNYGKEGKRTDFTPYSCVKVILSPPPGSDEVHGEGEEQVHHCCHHEGHRHSHCRSCPTPPHPRPIPHRQAARSRTGTSRSCARPWGGRASRRRAWTPWPRRCAARTSILHAAGTLRRGSRARTLMP